MLYSRLLFHSSRNFNPTCHWLLVGVRQTHSPHSCIRLYGQRLSRLTLGTHAGQGLSAPKDSASPLPESAKVATDSTPLAPNDNVDRPAPSDKLTQDGTVPTIALGGSISRFWDNLQRKRQQTGESMSPNMHGVMTQLSTQLNQVTGYHEVAQLKLKVIDSEKAFLAARERLRRSKTIYEAAVSQRASGQREINGLLQRKHTWSDSDVVRFTQLYRDEHTNEQAELAAKGECASAEREVEHRYDCLVDAIRARYHEEQLWSDKIRGASTYGTLALMLINVLLFISVQTIFEPRKRAKLGKHVEELLVAQAADSAHTLQECITDLQTSLATQHDELEQLTSTLAALTEQVASSVSLSKATLAIPAVPSDTSNSTVAITATPEPSLWNNIIEKINRFSGTLSITRLVDNMKSVTVGVVALLAAFFLGYT